MKTMLFMMNPKAGHQELRSQLMDILDRFTAGGYTVTVRPTQGRGDLTQWVLQHGGEYDVLVCAGGDGTLNEAVSALVQMEKPPKLGFLPAGTVNDMAQTLGIPREPLKAADTILEDNTRCIDVGQFGDDRYFSYVAGFGAFTDVSYETPQEEKRVLGRLAYLLNGVKSLGSLKAFPMKMILEDRVIEDQVMLGLVCSTTSVGGFRTPMEGVSLDDGLFEVIVAKEIKSLQDLNAVTTLLTRREFDPRFFYTFQTNRVRFEFEQSTKWTLDGEFGGAPEAVDICNLHRAVEIFVPNSEKNPKI